MTTDLNTLREALEPCPFCGGAPMDIPAEDMLGSFRIVCPHCGTCGPEQLGANAAIDAWNRRAPRPEAATAPELSQNELVRCTQQAGGEYRGQWDLHQFTSAELQHFASLVRSVTVGEVKPVAEGFFTPDGRCVNASASIGYLRPNEKDASAGCTIRPLYTTPPAPIEGWRMVPVEPTPEMIAAWPNFRHGSGHQDQIYRAMLAAAPQPGDKA